MSSFGCEGEGARDADALLLTAGQLVRVPVAVRPGQLDGVEQLLDPHVEVSRPSPRPTSSIGSPMDCADRQSRVQRRRRVLEDDADVLVHLVQQAAVGLRDVVADDVGAAVRDREEADGGAPDGGLARAGLADEAGHLAGVDREGRVARRRGTRERGRAWGSRSRRPRTSSTGAPQALRGARVLARRDLREARSRSSSPASAAVVSIASPAGLADARHGGEQLLRVRMLRARRRRPSTVPRSTISPWRITTMSSARSATTPMSWVMSRIAESRRWRRSRMRSRISACTVTSSAVVGSSAIRSYGSHEIGLRDHGALTLTAGELVRVGVERLQRVGQLDEVEQLRARGPSPRSA